MENLIVLKRQDLEELLVEITRKALAASKDEEPKKEAFGMDEAVAYLNRKGLRTTKSSVYKAVADDRLPFRKPAGRRNLIFLASELDEYIAGQLGERLPDRTIEKAVAKSARRKMA